MISFVGMQENGRFLLNLLNIEANVKKNIYDPYTQFKLKVEFLHVAHMI